VLGKYHPHGDSSVYDALVRMVQDFSLRYPLVDGQGNFGASTAIRRGVPIHRSAAHAHRDGDARRHRQEHRRFRAQLRRPLRSRQFSRPAVPNLSINGSSGIAVGMATNIPPHNIAKSSTRRSRSSTTRDRSAALERSSRARFPDGRLHLRPRGIKDYQETGRGRIVMRARAVIEEKESSNKSQIVVTELPYQVNRRSSSTTSPSSCATRSSRASPTCADESDKDGMRIVDRAQARRDSARRAEPAVQAHDDAVDVRRDHARARFQSSHTGRLVPKIMPLKEVLVHYIDHRHTVIVRRTQFELDKALEREHILEGPQDRRR
jgi:DNA gyrase subunit A